MMFHNSSFICTRDWLTPNNNIQLKEHNIQLNSFTYMCHMCQRWYLNIKLNVIFQPDSANSANECILKNPFHNF